MKKNLIFIFIVTLFFSSCNKPAGELTGTSNLNFLKGGFNENNPYGMVFVKRGSFMMGANDQSAFGSSSDKPVNVTVDAFWMDETEITNDEYKQFVSWVRDSIALRRMIIENVPGYEKMMIYEDKASIPDLTPEELEKVQLNWKTKIPWETKDTTLKRILNYFYYDNINHLSKKRQLNPGKLTYRYEWINYDQASLAKNKYNVNTGAYPTNAKVRVDTSYIDDSGVIINKTIERKLKSRKDLISNKVVTIYPDTMMWLRDFQFAFNDPKMHLYFSHPGFSNYPVVGVTWEQAQAFCNWRTQLFNSHAKVGAQEYRLPTEAEWEYAARGGISINLYPWGGNYVRDAKGCYLANFKPMRGSYTDDTGATTMKVGSFIPNNFGLYDMAGNVAEWTSSAFVNISNLLVSDMNPNYQFSAKKDDSDLLKRKVIKGGSWKDVAYYLQCGIRTYEYQFESRPYIGFRCVRSYNGE
ncbi:MAG: SUMF1/EgtB/PvdO family nonheme iron enzyme [Paludibacter sp.]|nr:SUMF1/EgtB/PvdO family nonheme iron enzyme [Paludibacter sp.]